MFDFSQEEEIKSFALLQPGVNIPAKLKSVEINEKGDLLVAFEGTGEDKGVITQRFWANEFDSDQNEAVLDGKQKRLKQIVHALVPKTQLSRVKGATTAELYNNIAQVLSAVIEADCKLKVVYQRNSDEYIELPIFTDCISSDLRPAGLYLRKSVDNNGIPRDRIKPLAEYGVAPESPKTESTGFGEEDEEEELPFGDE